jgi:ribosomal protein S8E
LTGEINADLKRIKRQSCHLLRQQRRLKLRISARPEESAITASAKPSYQAHLGENAEIEGMERSDGNVVWTSQGITRWKTIEARNRQTSSAGIYKCKKY